MIPQVQLFNEIVIDFFFFFNLRASQVVLVVGKTNKQTNLLANARDMG